MDRGELMKLSKEEIIEYLFTVIKDMSKTIQVQREEIDELKARLNQNSKNSSNPPSRDVYDKPKSLRKPSGKKAGGQSGHEGKGLKLMAEPDKYVSYEPQECTNCPKAAECQADKTVCETRYEIDIEVRTITTAHQITRVTCPQSAKMLAGEFPDYINSSMQYGVNLKALAVSLNTVGMVSINRTHEILSGVFDVPISTGTISAMVSDCAQTVKSTVDEIKEAVKNEPLVHEDETGTRVDKRNAWAHVSSTESLTYIEMNESRGKKGMDAIGILTVFLGTLIHDCWASYFLYTNIRHGLCNAHLLRELTAVWENAKQAWAQELMGLVLEMKSVKEKLLSQNILEPPKELLEKFNLAFDKILEEALALNPVPVPDKTKKGKPKRGKTGALVDRLILRKGEFLLFFTDFSIPFDNNQAERDFRMFKVKQKVSGGFRTMQGAKDFAAIMSYTGTARKRGIPAFYAIKNALIGMPFSV